MAEKEQILSFHKGTYVFRLGLLNPSQCFVLSRSKIPLVRIDDACKILNMTREKFIATWSCPVFSHNGISYLYLVDFSWTCSNLRVGLDKEVSA